MEIEFLFFIFVRPSLHFTLSATEFPKGKFLFTSLIGDYDSIVGIKNLLNIHYDNNDYSREVLYQSNKKCYVVYCRQKSSLKCLKNYEGTILI